MLFDTNDTGRYFFDSRLTVKKKIYSETVDAECIGYARYFETESGETLMPNSGVPCVSPVFSYRYNGQLAALK